jgi:hypothetical protein
VRLFSSDVGLTNVSNDRRFRCLCVQTNAGRLGTVARQGTPAWGSPPLRDAARQGGRTVHRSKRTGMLWVAPRPKSHGWPHWLHKISCLTSKCSTPCCKFLRGHVGARHHAMVGRSRRRSENSSAPLRAAQACVKHGHMLPTASAGGRGSAGCGPAAHWRADVAVRPAGCKRAQHGQSGAAVARAGN